MSTGELAWAGAFAYIALLWVLSMILYAVQTVDVDIRKCELLKSIGNNCVRYRISGYMRARHDDALSELRLCIKGHEYAPLSSLSDFEKIVDSHPREFLLEYEFPLDDLLSGREEQTTREKIDVGQLCAVMYNGIWRSIPFKMPGDVNYSEDLKMAIMNKLQGKSARVKEIGISPKKYHELIKKASQPIKKSEKGKS